MNFSSAASPGELALDMIDGLKGWDTDMDFIGTEVGTPPQSGKATTDVSARNNDGASLTVCLAVRPGVAAPPGRSTRSGKW